MLNRISDFLYDTTDFETVKEVNNNPAILFTNTSTSEFGNVYIFEKFGVEKANTIKFSSSITTHYMEDNTARQDHWAINPVTYTLSGLIGEVVFTPPKQYANFVQKNIIDYLAPLSILSPTFDSYTQSAISTVAAIEASVNRYRQIFTQTLNNIQGIGNTNIIKRSQSRVIEWLENLRDNRQLVNIWTPYGEYDNMAINDFQGSQNDSKFQSDLEIQFTQWRNVSTATRKATKEEQAYFCACQQAETQEIGTASTKYSDAKAIYKYKTQDFWGNPL
jgi:hypothetical protein